MTKPQRRLDKLRQDAYNKAQALAAMIYTTTFADGEKVVMHAEGKDLLDKSVELQVAICKLVAASIRKSEIGTDE